jgi:hypothetical protein
LVAAGLLLGALIGLGIADAVLPERHHKGITEELERQRMAGNAIIYEGMVAGGFAGLFLSAITYKRPSDPPNRPPVG